MGGFDRQVRNEAVTMRANVFGHNYMDETEYDLTKGAYTVSGGYSDLCPLVGIAPTTGAAVTPTPGAINSIRIMQPHQGELVEAYVDYLQIRSAIDGTDGSTMEKAGLGMYIAIGDFTNNDFTTPRTSYTLDEIKASWKKISGRSLPIAMLSGGGGDWRIIASRINLLPEIKKAGNAKFVEDGYNLILAFGDTDGKILYAPTSAGIPGAFGGSNFAFEFFRVVQSMTGVQ